MRALRHAHITRWGKGKYTRTYAYDIISRRSSIYSCYEESASVSRRRSRSVISMLPVIFNRHRISSAFQSLANFIGQNFENRRDFANYNTTLWLRSPNRHDEHEEPCDLTIKYYVKWRMNQVGIEELRDLYIYDITACQTSALK